MQDVRVGIIYIARNKVNGKVYVGQTVRRLEVRMREHARFEVKTSLLERAIRKYGIEQFDLITVDGVPVELLDSWEAFFIRSLGTLAPHGYNLTLGGPGIRGHRFSDETKAKMRSRKIGTHHTPEQTEKIRMKLIGRKMSEGWREKLSVAALAREAQKKEDGFSVSEETRRKLSMAGKRRYEDPEERAKLRVNRGPHSEERKEKIRQAQIGRVFSDETRRKMSESARHRRKVI